jgi:hypothetical protein
MRMCHTTTIRKGDGTMEIVTLDMKSYLGRGVQVFLKNGKSMNYRPMELVNGNKWRGLDDEQNIITIREEAILFVKSPVMS